MRSSGLGSKGGENLLHVNMIRLRVTGQGNMKATFFSLDDVRSYPLVDLEMSSTPGRNLDRLAGVAHEARVYLELKTTEIDEIFRLNKVMIFVKPIASQYPG